MSLPRNEYQDKRLRFLQSLVSLDAALGLEIGACDLPTVPHRLGRCQYADFRNADEMSRLWGRDRASVCDVNYVIGRHRPLSEQINERFDYVVACHVLEHVPNPIGYIKELADLTRRGPARPVFLAIPDKRQTSDRLRPSTTIDHLLMDHSDDCRYPPIEHIIEFHRFWLEDQTGTPLPLVDAFDYAVSLHAGGTADVHCHVWTDDEFREQFEALGDGGFLGDLRLLDFEPTLPGFNEFVAVFGVPG